MEYTFLILAHVLGASVWAGGHLILATTILPAAWRRRDIELVRRFEERYERIGIPALLIQVVTGLRLSYLFMPDFQNWFGFHERVSSHLTLKLILLGATLLLAVHARTRLIPKLSLENLTVLAIHIIAVTVLAVLFVFVGVSLRVGGLF